MSRRVVSITVSCALAGLLAGCAFSFFHFEQRAAWRNQAERACFVSGAVKLSAYVQPAREIRDGAACGIERPLKVAAFGDGTIGLSPTATLACSETAALTNWVQNSVVPASMTWFGSPVIEIEQMASYGCRSIDSIPGEQLSEHAFGNAMDVGGFRLANGREIKIKSGWMGAPDERNFLRQVEASACEIFTTVLGPGSDRYHSDQFHLDLAHHGKSGISRYCKPAPVVPSPPTAIYDDTPVGSIKAPQTTARATAFVAPQTATSAQAFAPPYTPIAPMRAPSR